MLDGKKMWAVSAGWLDYDNDGLLDLFVSNYCKWEVNQDPVCRPESQRALLLPSQVLRARFPIRFTTITATEPSPTYRRRPASASICGKGMGVVFADYDRDGFMDVFVANDNCPNLLFHNLGGKKFEEVALESGVAYPQSANAISSMGADFKDVYNDGRPTSGTPRRRTNPSRCFATAAVESFVEVTDQSLLGVTRTMSGWSNGIFDFDNDGWKDLFVARGNVLDNVALDLLRKPTASPMRCSATWATASFGRERGAGAAFQTGGAPSRRGIRRSG